MASENVKEFTESNFEQEVLKSETPVLVDFWAEWCMPCRMLAPTIDKLATDYAGKVKVGKVDTDANREIALKYRIESIPTVILFKGGQVVEKFVGVQKKDKFKAALDQGGAGERSTAIQKKKKRAARALARAARFVFTRATVRGPSE